MEYNLIIFFKSRFNIIINKHDVEEIEKILLENKKRKRNKFWTIAFFVFCAIWCADHINQQQECYNAKNQAEYQSIFNDSLMRYDGMLKERCDKQQCRLDTLISLRIWRECGKALGTPKTKLYGKY